MRALRRDVKTPDISGNLLKLVFLHISSTHIIIIHVHLVQSSTAVHSRVREKASHAMAFVLLYAKSSLVVLLLVILVILVLLLLLLLLLLLILLLLLLTFFTS